MNSFQDHILRQMAFSRATFGPGPRTEGVSDHIREELGEVAIARVAGLDTSDEWVDVALLALDGLWRALEEELPTFKPDEIASLVAYKVRAKQGVNEKRVWPNWRDSPEDKKINHVKGSEDVG